MDSTSIMNSTSIQVWQTIGIWITGLATFAAVVFSLYMRRYYERKQRPRLVAKFEPDHEGDLQYIPPLYSRGLAGDEKIELPKKEELWIRVRVRNDSDILAKDVELRLIYAKRERKGSNENRPSWWFKVSNLDSTSIKIPPSFEQPFDIAFVSNIEGLAKDLDFCLAIVRPDIKPWLEEKERMEKDIESNGLSVGWTYILRMALISNNADAKNYEMELIVDPREKEDPPLESLLGEKLLRKRLNVISFEEVTD